MFKAFNCTVFPVVFITTVIVFWTFTPRQSILRRLGEQNEQAQTSKPKQEPTYVDENFYVDDTNGTWFANDGLMHENFTCPFAVYNFNCWTQSQDKAKYCAGQRYIPNKSFERVDHTSLFTKFMNRRIIFEGDSISELSFINLACRLVPFLLSHHIHREKFSCVNHRDVCTPDNDYAPIHYAKAIFSLFENNIAVEFWANWDGSTAKPWHTLERGDVLVLNHGLHFMPYRMQEFHAFIVQIVPQLRDLQRRGVHVVWRETSAPKFLTGDSSGVWSTELRPQQEANEARCVDMDKIDLDAAWKGSTNSFSTPYMKKNGIPVLNIWKASLRANGACNIGGGRDCIHFCEPGVYNYFTDILLAYLWKLPTNR